MSGEVYRAEYANEGCSLAEIFVIPQSLPLSEVDWGSAFSFAIFCPKIACQAPRPCPTAQNPTTTRLSGFHPFGKFPCRTAYH
jgi:hypothetical protein